MHRNLSKIIYLIVCFVFFLFSDLYLSNLLVREINSGLNINNGVFALNYIKNNGAAFSILSCVAIVLLFLYVFKHIKSISMKSIFFVSLLTAGIAGNLHERIVFGYVRDFFELTFVNFPVFNISDIFINIGVIALIILILLKKTK